MKNYKRFCAYFHCLATILSGFVCLSLLSSCSRSFSSQTDTISSKNSASPQNVILLIGDGMGPQQIGLALHYAKYVRSTRDPNFRLALEDFISSGESALIIPSAKDAIVVDSACAATALATGQEALPNTIGINPDGQAIETVLEHAKKFGKWTGLVSDTRITHATPAAFIAHLIDREDENEIARQIVAGSADVLLSGGLRHFLPSSAKQHHKTFFPYLGKGVALDSSRSDERNLLQEAQARGYHLAFNRDQLLQNTQVPLLGLFSSSFMPDGISESRSKSDAHRSVPTLAEMTHQALSTLEKAPQGFFLMVEAGQIDFAGHSNDVGMLLFEMLKLDSVLKEVSEWRKSNPDTLVILTADHETGSFGFSYSSKDIPAPRPLSSYQLKDRHYKAEYNYVKPSIFEKIERQKRTLFSLSSEYLQLPKGQQNARTMQKLVQESTAFSLPISAAQAVVRTRKNPYYNPNYPDLNFPITSYINDFDAFYPKRIEPLAALISRALASDLGVVWGTGNHTSTPVLAVASGVNEFFSDNALLYQDQLGQKLLRAVE